MKAKEVPLLTNLPSVSVVEGVAVSAYGFHWFKIEDILKYHTEVPKSLTQDEVRELRQLLFNN